jgi:hypothetical protein
MTTSVATTTQAAWPYSGEDSPQQLTWAKDYATVQRLLGNAKKRLADTPKPGPVPADNATVNLSGERRWGRLDEDAKRADKVVTIGAEIALLENRLEYLDKRRPLPFTREELEAARVVRTEMGWDMVQRVNGLTVTVGRPQSQSRISLDKVLEVRA